MEGNAKHTVNKLVATSRPDRAIEYELLHDHIFYSQHLLIPLIPLINNSITIDIFIKIIIKID